jgi:hypothetical protein
VRAMCGAIQLWTVAQRIMDSVGAYITADRPNIEALRAARAIRPCRWEVQGSRNLLRMMRY